MGRSEDCSLRQNLKRLSGLLFGEASDILKPFSRVAISRTRHALEGQLAARLTSPIRKARLMAQCEPRCQQFAALVIGDVGVSPIGIHGFVQ